QDGHHSPPKTGFRDRNRNEGMRPEKTNLAETIFPLFPKSFTFTNGNMVLDLARLRLGQKALLGAAGPLFSRLFANWSSFNFTVQSAQGNDRLTQEDAELMWAHVQLQDGHRMNHLVIQYLKDRRRFEKTRWLPSLSLVKEPVHICWGDADAVSPAKVARHLKEHVCPRARLTLMPDVWHFCHPSDHDKWLARLAWVLHRYS